jgi:hypothetical protein
MNNILHHKKYLVLALMVLVLFSPLGATLAHAQATPATSAPTTPTQTPNFFSCVGSTGNVATCSVYFMAIVINSIIGFFVSTGAFLVRIGLQFNDNIVDSPAVQIGFSVVLSLANLGFVLGIIIIALATIVRNQTYGIKQLLWKLVVMAILVNFGLVIAAPIISFADSMSQFFVTAIGGNTTTVAGATDGYESFVMQMTNAFQPQAVALPQMTTQSAATTVGLTTCEFGLTNNPAVVAFCQKLLGVEASQTPPDTFMQTLIAVFFGISYGATVAFTFLVLAVLLLVRYLFLSGLLIVLPLAWLTWIFPKFDNSFHKWWNNFVKWVMFPPLALFFIYLGFQTATTTTSALAYEQLATQLPTQAVNGPEWSMVAESGLSAAIPQVVNEVLLVGLTMMGLMFALSLSGKAGTIVVDTGKSGAKMAAGYVGKKTKQAAGRAVPQNLKQKLQGAQYSSLLLPKRLQVAAGVGLGNLERAGRGDMVAAQTKKAETLAKDPAQFARILQAKAGEFGKGAISKDAQMAMLGQLAKDEVLQREVNKQGDIVGGKHVTSFLRENEADFKSGQQEKVLDTLKDKYGVTLLENAEKSKDAQKIVLELAGKEKLQEIKTIKEDLAAGKPVSDSDKKRWRDYSDREDYLEYVEKNAVGPKADLMSGTERQELANMRAMEATKGDYMTPADKTKYAEAKDVFDKNNPKGWVARNPAEAAEVFQDHQKALEKLDREGKPKPLTFEPAAVQAMQEAILTSMAEGFSPQNARALIEAIGKKNNLKYFESAMSDLEARDSEKATQIKLLAASNKPLADWIMKNPGRTIVDLGQMFGIKPVVKKGTDKTGDPKNKGDDDDDNATA